MVSFAYTILYVSDVLRTVTFYETVFGLQRKFIAPDNAYAEMITGSTTLSFAVNELAASNLPNGFDPPRTDNKPQAVEIGFATDAVEEAVSKALAAGGTLEAPATTKPWGQVVAYVRDPDGHLVEICTPLG